MNSNKYPMTNYVPAKPKLDVCKDIHNKLKKMDFDEIINDPTTHFKNVYVTNFDLIHHSARGDPLPYSKKFYQTIAMSDLKQIDFPNSYAFVAAAIRSQCDDVYFEKEVLKKHFKDDIELKLLRKGIFLSSMKKRAYLKKKDKCKSLFF